MRHVKPFNADAEIPPEANEFWEDVAEADSVPPPWIIPGLLPVGLYFIGGPAKTYKTTVLVGMLNLVSGHECGLLPPYLSRVEREGRVMLLEAEANPGELRHMIEVDMGVKLEADGTILTAKDTADFRLDDPGAIKRLLYWLNKYKPRALAIDPMREFHDLDEKDSGDMQRLLRPLRRWAIDNDAAIVVVHHTTKPGEQHTGVYNPLDLRGSSALFGAANGVLMLSPTKTDGQLVFSTQFKRGAPWTATLQLGIFGRKAVVIYTQAELKLLSLLRAAPIRLLGTLGEFRAISETTLAAQIQQAERWVHDTLVKFEQNDLASQMLNFKGTWIANTMGVSNG